jgi:molybdopterin-containing oxidoreductase family membrane subunit
VNPQPDNDPAERLQEREVDELGRIPVLRGEHTYASVTEKISSIVLTQKTPLAWWIVFGISAVWVGIFLFTVGYLLSKGIGIWGTNIPVGWAFPITNFVWWIGIGHAGTLISAILLLLKQQWRTSINRFAEAMTLIAVTCAGLFPLLHLGRPWVFHWILPYPNVMGLWPQFRSPLVWDVFAVLTYFTVSLLFWYAGLIPDMATLRDRAKSRLAKTIYGALSMGWRGSAIHWQRFEISYLLLGGLATPLVVSVHSIVGMDFAVAQLPGWHSTIFPPYFVAGAIFSGFAMVLTLAIPMRAVYGLQDLITINHIENSCKVLIATGSVVGYGYLTEGFMAWYSQNTYEQYTSWDRAFGAYAWGYWCLIVCNVLTPHLFWIPRFRRNVIIVFILSLVIQFGMWMERFVIIVQSLHRDWLPSSWHMFYPTVWDFTTLFGSIGVFFFLFMLFIRYLPMISIFELRELVDETAEQREEARG